MDVKAYAASIGRAKYYQTVRHEAMAAEVARAANLDVYNGSFYPLVEIHAAPGWLWSALGRA